MTKEKQIAVILDLDGTMVDNKFYHIKAWIEFCRRHGIEMTMEEFERKGFGGSNRDYLSQFLNRTISDKEDYRLGEEKEQIYRELYQPFLKPINGLEEFLKELKYNNVKTAIATMAPMSNVKFVIDNLLIGGYFDEIVDYYQVKKGKPDPEIFIKASERLQVHPEDCIVIEDSFFGIRAALNAGMKVIGITTYHTNEELEEAHQTIHDFTELDVSKLYRIHKS